MKRTVTGLLVAAALVLAGCAVEVPQVEADPEPTGASPVLTSEQLDQVLAEVQETLTTADEAASVEEVGDRLIDPAREIRAAEYRFVAATADGDSPATLRPLTTSSQVDVVAATTEWPRLTVVVTEVPENTNVPLLLGLIQAEPRAPYALFHYSLLMPGTEFPPFVQADVGVEQVSTEEEGLVATPAEAVAQYADVLSQGEDSDFTDNFADDPLRSYLETELTELVSSAEDAGTVSSTSEAYGPVYALRTAEGSVLVMGGLRSTLTFERTIDGSTMQVGPEFAALNDGDGEVEDRFVVTYLSTMAFVVPPAGEGAQIQPIAAERVISGAQKESDADE